MRRLRFALALFLASSLLSFPLAAQGNQNVPATPVACAVLRPAAANKSTLDTERIQRALNACAPGRAVVLAGGEFRSAPLVVPRCVTLFVDGGVTLYASKNVRDYDLTPGSCDPAKSFDPNHETPYCKPFIYSYQAAYSAVIGSGTIDGNGTPRELVTSYESQGFTVSGVTLRGAVGTLLAVYKTLHFAAEHILLKASEANTDGLLLSNAVEPVLQQIWVEVPGWSLLLKASILGPTTKAQLGDVRVLGGKGISLGDPIYGDMKEIAFQRVDIHGAKTGIAIRNEPAHGPIPSLTLSDVCMQNVMTPVSGANLSDIHISNFSMTGPSGLPLVGAGGTFEPNSNVDNPRCSDRGLAVWDGWLRGFIRADGGILQQPGTKRDLTVAASGGDFTTVQAAVDALPADGGTIRVMPGTYKEVVTIRKPHVRVFGAEVDAAKTTITYGSCAPVSGGTFNTGTVFAEADDITIENLTIVNDCDQHEKGQAVALHTQGDRNIFRNLRILGSTDTLYASAKLCYGDYGPCVPARQYFADTFVEGGVDFIFGDSIAYFDHCTLHGLPAGNNVMFTAQSKHYPAEQSGYVFADAHIVAEARKGRELLTLGRAWRPYGSVVFLHAKIDAPLPPEGWTDWPRFGVPTLPTAYYAEFESTGRGANPAGRERYAHQLSAAEAAQYTLQKVLGGEDHWNPQRSSSITRERHAAATD